MEMHRASQLPKRTRRNVKQSKNGCFTCKDRRKKCGEEKPHCTRCIKAGLKCAGYTPDRTSATSVDYSLAPGQRMSGAARSGLEILIQTADDRQPWGKFLPWLAHTSPLVHAALTALGATYQATLLPLCPDPRKDRVIAHGGYHAALIALRTNLTQPSDSVAECFLAAVVLAAVEALQFRAEAALMHLRGAYHTLQQSPRRGSQSAQDQEHLMQLALHFDVQTMSFALSIPSALPASIVDAEDLSETETPHLATKVAAILHACYDFATHASQFKYTVLVSKQMLMMQGRYAGILRCARKALDDRIAHEANAWVATLLCSYRAQILSALIYLYSLFVAEEARYDMYLGEFRQILEDCRRSLSQRPQTPLSQFRPISSLSQSLFFTAIKCRNRDTRQSAIEVLSRTGVEGPWDARILTAVASRVVELENLPNSEGQSPLVDESRLIHGFGWQHVDDGHATDQTLRFTARFSRCVDVQKMIDNTSPDLEQQCIPWDSPDNWIIWEEDFQVAKDLNSICT